MPKFFSTPRNSIAVVGLARVKLDRGDEEGALELGRRALEIDPENDAAIRLYERAGFVCYGTLPRAICVDGTYYAKDQMVLTL